MAPIIHKRFEKTNITRKKTFTYSEKSEEAGTAYLNAVDKIPAQNRVYIDECGIKEGLKREYGWAVRGVKIEDTKRGKRFHRVSVAAAAVHDENGARTFSPLCYKGSMNGEGFEGWIKNKLLAGIKDSGNTIIMDNAPFRRKGALKALYKEGGVNLLFLPPYSPGLNPVEKDWALGLGFI